MMETRQPIVVPDVQHSAEWVPYSDQEWRRSYVAIPFLLRGEVIGFIALASGQVNSFPPTVVERLQLLAHQVALAVQSVRLHQQAKELAAAQERQQLARDLHDAVSQTLFAANVIAESVQRQWLTNGHLNEAQLDQLCQLTRSSLAEMRMLLLELRPNTLREVGLDVLLRQFTLAVQSRKQINLSLKIDGDLALPPDVKACLFRVAQEALNNVVKHSRASVVLVHLRTHAGQAELEVADNGRGFDEAAVQASSMGLKIMHERAQDAGVHLSMTSAPEQGTRVIASWAAPRAESDAPKDV